MNTNKRAIALLLAAVLALSLMLTACNKGGDNPTGDNATPGTSSSPEGTASGGDATPGNTNTTPKTWLDPSKYDTEKKTRIDEISANAQTKADKIDVDINSAIEGAFAEYGEYFDGRITCEAVRTAIALRLEGEQLEKSNISRIKNEPFNQASDFIVGKGKQALDITDPVQNIAAFAIATTLQFVTNFENWNDPVTDLGVSFSYGFDGKEQTTFSFSSFMEWYYVQQ